MLLIIRDMCILDHHISMSICRPKQFNVDRNEHKTKTNKKRVDTGINIHGYICSWRGAPGSKREKEEKEEKKDKKGRRDKKKKKGLTTPAIPVWSPTTVLRRLDRA